MIERIVDLPEGTIRTFAPADLDASNAAVAA
jgi:hypothetical protein